MCKENWINCWNSILNTLKINLIALCSPHLVGTNNKTLVKEWDKTLIDGGTEMTAIVKDLPQVCEADECIDDKKYGSV